LILARASSRNIQSIVTLFRDVRNELSCHDFQAIFAEVVLAAVRFIGDHAMLRHLDNSGALPPFSSGMNF
jgi:hypothetical protein